MNSNINTNTTTPWTTTLEAYCIQDPGAPASILGYYLNNLPDYSSIFCPLGYKPYAIVGQTMWNDPEVFEAAIDTGLMCSAVSNHIYAALDVWENWNAMKPGILYLRNHLELSRYIEIRDKVFIDALKDVEDEDTWYDTVSRIHDQLNSGELKGY